MTSTPRIAILGGTVLMGSPLTGSFQRADLLVEDGRIAHIGELPAVVDAAAVDATGMLVLPGFVDTHAHLWEASMRGITAEWDLLDFAYGIRFHHAALHQPDDVYAGAHAGALASIDSGTTTVLDHAHILNSPEHADEALTAVTDAGIRAVWAYSLNEVPLPTPVFTAAGQRWDDLRRIRRTHTDGLVMLGVAPNEVGSVPWGTLVAEYKLARELDLPLTAHLDGTWGPARAPEVEWLHRAGVLGSRQVFSHANTASDTELRLLADHGAAVTSTPDTELRMGLGFPILPRAAAHGVTTGLGSDIQANNSADLFSAMRLARQAGNGYLQQTLLDTTGTGGLDGVPISCRQILHTATLGGAQALGLDDLIGSLEPGKQADIVLLRADTVRHRPIVDPFATVVLHTHPGDVDTVLVAGRPVKRGGVLAGADRAAQQVEAAFARLSERMHAAHGRCPRRPDGLIEQVAAAAMANAPHWINQ